MFNFLLGKAININSLKNDNTSNDNFNLEYCNNFYYSSKHLEWRKSILHCV